MARKHGSINIRVIENEIQSCRKYVFAHLCWYLCEVNKPDRYSMSVRYFEFLSICASHIICLLLSRSCQDLLSLSQDIMNFAHKLAFKFNLYLNLCEMCRRSLSNFFPNMRYGHVIYKFAVKIFMKSPSSLMSTLILIVDS